MLSDIVGALNIDSIHTGARNSISRQFVQNVSHCIFMYYVCDQKSDNFKRACISTGLVAVREETIMTFHGRARRRSRRAVDTLDAQVNCNRERRSSWLVRSARLNVTCLDERDKEKKEGEKDETDQKCKKKKSYAMMIMMMMQMMVVSMTIDICDAT